MHDCRHNHLYAHALALICFARKDERLSALAEVHAEMDSEAIAQLEERPELLSSDHQVVSKAVATRRRADRTHTIA
jgi:hypothetical protein